MIVRIDLTAIAADAGVPAVVVPHARSAARPRARRSSSDIELNDVGGD